MKVRSPVCPGCGGALPLRDAAPWVRCDYCGREVEIARTVQMSTPALPARTPRRSLWWWLAGFGVASAALAAFVMSRPAPRPASAGASHADASVPAPAPTPPDARVPGLHAWVSNGNLPVLADLDGDGVEDVIGRFSQLEPDHVVWLGAFSGAGLTLLWRAGPFADWPGEVRYAQAGDQLVVVDPSPAVHVLDRATGETLHRTDLTDQVKQLCVAPEGDAVFVDVIDEQHVRVTPATGAIEPAARPAWCTKWRFPSCPGGLRNARCTPVDRAFRRDDRFRLEYLVRGDDVVLGVGYRTPGSRFPMLAGFASGGRELRWHRLAPEGEPRAFYESAPEFVDLVDGTGFAVYVGAKHEVARLQAFDPATGAIAWDVVIPGGDVTFFATDWLVATRSRVYLAHDRYTLQVFDRATGAVIDGVGFGHE